MWLIVIDNCNRGYSLAKRLGFINPDRLQITTVLKSYHGIVTREKWNQTMATLIDSKAIGVEVSWSFGDGDAEAVTLDRYATRQLFEDCGFYDLIEDITPSEALVRASRLAPRVRDISVKEFKRPNRDTPRSFGIYYVTTEEGESGDQFICGSRVRIEYDTAVCVASEDGIQNPKCMEIGNRMADTANKLLSKVINADLSAALLSIGHSKLFWISRRKNQGGVYYLQNDSRAESFVKLLHALRDATQHELRYKQFIPQIVEMYPRPLTMETWEGAAQDDFESKIDKLVTDLTSMQTDGKMRESTINKRADECDNLIQQAIKYKIFLKEKVEIISEKLSQIRTDFLAGLAENAAEADRAFEDIKDLTPKSKPRKNRGFQNKPKKENTKRKGRKIIDNIDDLFDV